ncbi:MAG: hypothetical protein JF567_09865 [Xanthomonadales bacterium]|nr:hypothetical protein [Xanthomonadales bacterium]
MSVLAAAGKQSPENSKAAGMLSHAVIGGIVLGCVDILFAWLFWRSKGVTVTDVFQSIARGVYGKQAAVLGNTSVAVGAACHFFIAVCMVLAWIEFVSFKPAFNRHWVAWGALYGLLLYVFMNFVVLPITPVGWPKFGNPEWIEASVFMHLLFGIWCGYCGSRYLARRH